MERMAAWSPAQHSCCLPDLAPVRRPVKLKTVVLRVCGKSDIPAGLLQCHPGLLVEDVAEAFIKGSGKMNCL